MTNVLGNAGLTSTTPSNLTTLSPSPVLFQGQLHQGFAIEALSPASLGLASEVLSPDLQNSSPTNFPMSADGFESAPEPSAAPVSEHFNWPRAMIWRESPRLNNQGIGTQSLWDGLVEGSLAAGVAFASALLLPDEKALHRGLETALLDEVSPASARDHFLQFFTEVGRSFEEVPDSEMDYRAWELYAPTLLSAGGEVAERVESRMRSFQQSQTEAGEKGIHGRIMALIYIRLFAQLMLGGGRRQSAQKYYEAYLQGLPSPAEAEGYGENVLNNIGLDKADLARMLLVDSALVETYIKRYIEIAGRLSRSRGFVVADELARTFAKILDVTRDNPQLQDLAIQGFHSLMGDSPKYSQLVLAHAIRGEAIRWVLDQLPLGPEKLRLYPLAVRRSERIGEGRVSGWIRDYEMDFDKFYSENPGLEASKDYVEHQLTILGLRLRSSNPQEFQRGFDDLGDFLSTLIPLEEGKVSTPGRRIDLDLVKKLEWTIALLQSLSEFSFQQRVSILGSKSLIAASRPMAKMSFLRQRLSLTYLEQAFIVGDRMAFEDFEAGTFATTGGFIQAMFEGDAHAWIESFIAGVDGVKDSERIKATHHLQAWANMIGKAVLNPRWSFLAPALKDMAHAWVRNTAKLYPLSSFHDKSDREWSYGYSKFCEDIRWIRSLPLPAGDRDELLVALIDRSMEGQKGVDQALIGFAWLENLAFSIQNPEFPRTSARVLEQMRRGFQDYFRERGDSAAERVSLGRGPLMWLYRALPWNFNGATP